MDLGNAYGVLKKEKVQFVPEKLLDLYIQYHDMSLFVIVALHELLGHGTGKLFYTKDGVPNYDTEIVCPLTNQKVGCYKDGQTWNGVFGDISSGYEECKADAVAIYLSKNIKLIRAEGEALGVIWAWV